MPGLAFDHLDRRLLDEFQRDFPLVPRPYAVLARRLGSTEAQVCRRLAALQARGAISRIGAVFPPNRVGASTLAALAVPAAELDQVAELVNGFPEVNHNYEREHPYNLWFVVAAPSAARLQEVLAAVGSLTGYEPLNLPMVEDFHIDLGFPLWGDRRENVPLPLREREGPAQRQGEEESLAGPNSPLTPPLSREWRVGDVDHSLVGALSTGLTLTERPYAELGARVDMDEGDVLDRLQAMVDGGIIRRFGVIVRHHELGFTANAMVVWDIPDERVAAVGGQLAASPQVTLCYRRRRQLPHWPYNLFCMVHGRDRGAVEDSIRQLVHRHDLAGFDRHVLFSRRRFKQCGAAYGKVA